jgi:hypothetical protein
VTEETQPYHNRPEPWSHPGFRPPVTLAKRERLRQFLIAQYGERFDRIAFDRLLGPPAIAPKLSARKRKPSFSRTIRQVEKSTGKRVTSATMPDGTKLTFDEPEPTEASNPLAPDAEVESWLSKQPRKN